MRTAIGQLFLSHSACFRESPYYVLLKFSKTPLAMIRPNHPIDSAPYILPSPLPQPTRRVKPVPVPAPETPVKTSIKRPLPVETEGVLDLTED
jgi:hypothetical protein